MMLGECRGVDSYRVFRRKKSSLNLKMPIYGMRILPPNGNGLQMTSASEDYGKIAQAKLDECTE